MEMRRLGKTGLRISALGLGTLTWGRDTLEADAATQLEAYVNAGGNVVDTSPTYGEGEAEAVLGKLLGEGSSGLVARDDLVIISKAGVARRQGHSFVEASRKQLLAQLEATLKNLHTDYLDLWMLQVPDPETDFDQVLATLHAAWSSGKARFVGLSNHSAWQCAYAAAELNRGDNPPGLAAVENEYSLLNRDIERELLPAADALKFGVIGWSALGRGVLTGKYRSSTPPDSRGASAHLQGFVQPYLRTRPRRIVESIATAAEGLHTSCLGVSLAWILQTAVDTALISARTTEQLNQILHATETKLPKQVLRALNEVSNPETPVD